MGERHGPDAAPGYTSKEAILRERGRFLMGSVRAEDFSMELDRQNRERRT